jgi:hypothetical protein
LVTTSSNFLPTFFLSLLGTLSSHNKPLSVAQQVDYPVIMEFYTVSHNSFKNRSFPWINHIQTGLCDKGICQTCGVHSYQPEGDIQVTLEPRKGSKWPDILGCGAYPLFIISLRTLEALRDKGIGNLDIGKVEIFGSIPSKLQSHQPPDYFWINGGKLRGAKLDFEASGLTTGTKSIVSP